MKTIAQSLDRLDQEENEPAAGSGSLPKTRKPRARAPEGETPAERFVRVGSARVSAALNAMELVGSLSSPSFEFTAEQMESALDAMARAYEDMETKLRARLNPEVEKVTSNRFRF